MAENYQMLGFCVVVLLTFSAGGAAVLLSVAVRNPSPPVEDAIRSLMFLATLGAGTIIGSYTVIGS